MPLLTLFNHKGGAGRTSTCLHLAGTLAALGRRVLLIDNDDRQHRVSGALLTLASDQ